MQQTTFKQRSSRGDGTRRALIVAALKEFAAHGFDAVSTRDLAREAGVNQALIGYHFGGKQGLYLAVFDHIAARMKALLGPGMVPVEKLLARRLPTKGRAASRHLYLPPLIMVVEAMLALMLSEETEHWAQLIMREQARPTAAFDRMYDGFMGGMLQLLTELVMRVRAEANRQQARLLVVGLVGQVVVWRVARAGVLRHMGWDSIGDGQAGRIKEAVRRNVTAQLLGSGVLRA